MKCYNYLITLQKHYKDSTFDLMQLVYCVEELDLPFCYIIHDKETDIHLHLILLCCTLKKTDLLKLSFIFKCCDITIINDNLKQVYNYLSHKDDDNKNFYDEKLIHFVCCNKDMIFSLSNIFDIANGYKISKKESEIDTLNSIANDIIYKGVVFYKDLLEKYGGICVKYYRTIRDLLDTFKFYIGD